MCGESSYHASFFSCNSSRLFSTAASTEGEKTFERSRERGEARWPLWKTAEPLGVCSLFYELCVLQCAQWYHAFALASCLFIGAISCGDDAAAIRVRGWRYVRPRVDTENTELGVLRVHSLGSHIRVGRTAERVVG